MEVNPQTTSPFFTRLPGEIRNQIYSLALTSPNQIIDPSLPPTHTAFAQAMYYRTEYHRIPNLSSQLFRTCKRMYDEIPISLLYSENVFRFTTWFTAHRFFNALPRKIRELVHDVEVDLRHVNDTRPGLEREWVQYLLWKQEFAPTIWTAKIGSLPMAAPNVKTLRLNIEAWKVTETMRSVTLLREFLAGPRDLERIVLTGLDGAELLFGSRETYLHKWGPVAFVGVMRFARLAGMVDWLAGCVRGEKEDKVVVWEKREQRVSLEIMTADFYKVLTGRRASSLLEAPSFDLAKGACMLEAYEWRWHSGEWPNQLRS